PVPLPKEIRMSRAAVVLAVFAAVTLTLFAQEPKKDEPKKEQPKYKPGDRTRPRPKVIDAGTASTADTAGKPPSDAVILFDGKDLSEWYKSGKKPEDADSAPTWKVENGHAEVKDSDIDSRKKFGSCQVHIEWATPKEVKGSDQGRGNSGVYLGAFGEVQVLD